MQAHNSTTLLPAAKVDSNKSHDSSPSDLTRQMGDIDGLVEYRRISMDEGSSFTWFWIELP
jgi:hypothetical protein